LPQEQEQEQEQDLNNPDDDRSSLGATLRLVTPPPVSSSLSPQAVRFHQMLQAAGLPVKVSPITLQKLAGLVVAPSAPEVTDAVVAAHLKGLESLSDPAAWVVGFIVNRRAEMVGRASEHKEVEMGARKQMVPTEEKEAYAKKLRRLLPDWDVRPSEVGQFILRGQAPEDVAAVARELEEKGEGRSLDGVWLRMKKGAGNTAASGL
jgi:hypothetical protein